MHLKAKLHASTARREMGGVQGGGQGGGVGAQMYDSCQPHTIDGGQSMCGDILGIHQLPIAALVCIEGVKEAILGPRHCCAVILKVCCKALVEPQLPPVITCHQVPKPLQSP